MTSKWSRLLNAGKLAPCKKSVWHGRVWINKFVWICKIWASAAKGEYNISDRKDPRHRSKRNLGGVIQYNMNI